MKATLRNGLLAAATAGLMVAGAGAANAFDLGGHTGPVEFKFAGVSTGQNTVGSTGLPGSGTGLAGEENTWTIGNVTSITDGFNNLWTSGQNGEFLTFKLYGISDISVVPDGTDFDIYSSGATAGATNGVGDGKIHIDVYLDNVPPGTASDLSGGPGARTSYSTYPTITDGSLFLSLELVPGVVADDPNTGVNELNASLFQNANSTTNPSDGSGIFLADVVGGSHASQFDTDGFTTLLGALTDMFGQFDFTPATNTGAPVFGCGDPSSVGYTVDPDCWENVVDDPIRANKIPEPATLGLVGVGLVALAGLSRRRRKAA